MMLYKSISHCTPFKVITSFGTTEQSDIIACSVSTIAGSLTMRIYNMSRRPDDSSISSITYQNLLSLVLLLLPLLVLLPADCCGGIAPLQDAAVQVVYLRFLLLQHGLLVIDLVSEPIHKRLGFLVIKACQ